MKRAAGRPRDLPDITELEAIPQAAGRSVVSGALPDDYVGGWAAHEDEQRRISLEATPAQRLAWLEDAIRFADLAGALPADDEDALSNGPT